MNCLKNLITYQPLLSNKVGLKSLILLLLNLSSENYELFKGHVYSETPKHVVFSQEDKVLIKDMNSSFNKAILQGIIVKTDEMKNLAVLKLNQRDYKSFKRAKDRLKKSGNHRKEDF